MEAAVDVGEKNGTYSNGFHALSASCMVGLLLAVKDKKLVVDGVVANGPVFRAGNVVWKGDMLQVIPTLMLCLHYYSKNTLMHFLHPWAQ
jgi:hypothetical protein